MAAPKGNNFWEKRSKHGRDKIFATPEIMWDAACEYFNWCIDNPWIAQEIHGKDPQLCEVAKVRPFTLTGLCIYLGINTKYFFDFKQNCSKDFSEVVTRIEEIIYTQKFEGAATGFFNANIIARDLGLIDKKELDANVKVNKPEWLTTKPDES